MAGSPTDDQIRIQYLLDTQQATKELEELSELTKLYKKDLQELQKQSNKTYSELTTAIKNSNAEQAKSAANQKEAQKVLQQNNQALSQAVSQLKETEKQTRKNNSAFRELATTLKFVLITIVGGAFLDVWRGFIQILSDATERARDFNKGIISLELGLRQLQRSGSEITFEELNQQVQDLADKFAFISEDESIEIFGELTSRLSRLGLETEKLGEAAEAAVALSFVGSFDSASDAVNALTDFVAGGLTQSLNNAGIQVDQNTVKLKALEKGLKFEELTESEKALVRLEVVLDQLGGTIEDVSAVSGNIEGALQNVEGKANEASAGIGKLLLPLKLIGEEIKRRLLEGLLSLLTTAVQLFGVVLPALVKGAKAGFDELVRSVATLAFLISELITGQIDFDEYRRVFNELGKNVGDAFADGYESELEKRAKQVAPLFKDGLGLGDEEVGVGPGVGEGADLSKAEEIFRDLFAKILELQRDFERDSKDLEEDYLRDLEEIDKKGARKREDIWEDYYDSLEDIQERANERIEDANLKLQRDIEDVNRQFRQKLEDAQRDFREEEIRAEKDFQEELRRLREDFLFDLDEAVRDRDARQIMRLIKKFQLDRDRLLREREQEQEERREDFEKELEDIRRWRERRLQEIRIDYQRRREEIAKQEAREREDAEKRRQRALEDLEEELEEQRQARLEKYEQQQQDLEEALRQRIEELVRSTIVEKQLTSEAADFIARKFREVFGPGGQLHETMGDFNSIIQNAVKQAKRDLEELENILADVAAAAEDINDAKDDASSDTNESGNTNNSLDTSGFATGGTLVATSPTLAMFGERQPEVAQFTTLSQMNSVSSLKPPTPQVASTQSANGKMTLEVLLSPDLEARIVDNTIGVMADVIVGVQERN